MHAYLFPGQGSQFIGMGLDLYKSSNQARSLFEMANQILGFRITDTMFDGEEGLLQQTHMAQPAIFIHSTILAMLKSNIKLDMVAGHSLGEFSALVASGVLNFEEGLKLVKVRASLMQEACKKNPGTMAAILGLPDQVVIEICSTLHEEIVIPANYNAPGQLVIAGTVQGVKKACELLQLAGVKKIVNLKVNGGFHSPLMEPAREAFRTIIEKMSFKQGICPIYQNVTAFPEVNRERIKKNLVDQLIYPVLWTKTIQQMVQDGAKVITECGPGKVLQGLAKKIASEVTIVPFS